MKSLILILILSLSAVVQADDQACLPAESANQVLQDFNIVSWSYMDSAWQNVKQVELCQKDDLVYTLVKSILYMQQSPKAAAATGLQSIVMQEGPLNFFKSRIKTIYLETENHYSDCDLGGVVAYVDRSEQNAMHICPNEIKNYSSSLMTSYILIHEARHIDGFTHTACQHGVMANLDAEGVTSGGCDPDFETQGSYGVGAAFLLDVYGSTEDPVLKQEARSNAAIDLIQRFNKLPLGLTQGAVTQSKAGDIAFFDGVTQFPLKMAPNFGVMAARNDGAVFFGRDGSAKTYLYSEKLGETEGGFAKQYRTEISEEDQNTLVDLFFSAHEQAYSCFLFERKLHCGRGTESDVVISLNAIKPVGFIQNESSAILKGKSLHIAAADGFIYELPLNYEQLRRSSESDFIKSKKPLNLVNLVTMSGKGEFAIDLTGQFSNYQKSKRKWTVVPAYKGQALKKVFSPYLWSKQIEDL